MNAQTKFDKLEILQDDFINSLDELFECQAEISGDRMIAARQIKKLIRDFWVQKFHISAPIVVSSKKEMREMDEEYFKESEGKMIDLQAKTKKFFEGMGYEIVDELNNEIAYCKYNTFKSGADSWFSDKEAKQITKEVLRRELEAKLRMAKRYAPAGVKELNRQLKELEEGRNEN